ncbi:MAG TPA: hypothetical protein VM785_11615 [Gaiellales bacterium]|nr:hypothetical protein [Gaiellales bacterium]
MLFHPSTATAVRRVTPHDARRISRACSHVTIPAEPAAAGYRYIDLGGERPPFYIRRFGFGDRSAAVVLAAPIEWSSGDDAERGAPALARCEVTIGARRVPWDDLLWFDLRDGESLLLAQRAVDAVVELDLLARETCPFCCAAASWPGGLRATR